LRDQLLARVLAHSQQRRLDEGDDAREVRRSGEERDLAEAFPGAEHGDALDMARGVFLQGLDAAGLHDVDGIAGLGLTDYYGARGHPDLVELPGDTREVLSGEPREDRRPCDRVDEVVHGPDLGADAENTTVERARPENLGRLLDRPQPWALGVRVGTGRAIDEAQGPRRAGDRRRRGARPCDLAALRRGGRPRRRQRATPGEREA